MRTLLITLLLYSGTIHAEDAPPIVRECRSALNCETSETCENYFPALEFMGEPYTREFMGTCEYSALGVAAHKFLERETKSSTEELTTNQVVIEKVNLGSEAPSN